MRIFGIRGATTTTGNSAAEIMQEAEKLMLEIISQNNLIEDRVVSVIFTTTSDLTAEFPSKACRRLGWNRVALLGAVEADVPHGLSRCIRVLVHAYLDLSAEPHHVYLNEAISLRPDRSAFALKAGNMLE